MSKLEQDQQPGPSSPTPLHNRLHGALEARRRSRGEADDESEIASDTELFDELERELEDESGQGGAMGRIREARWKELRSQMAEIQAQRDAPRGLGRVTEPTSEKELIQLLGDKGGELKEGGVPIVVHFYHKEFRRCDIMGRHLEVSALTTARMCRHTCGLAAHQESNCASLFLSICKDVGLSSSRDNVCQDVSP